MKKTDLASQMPFHLPNHVSALGTELRELNSDMRHRNQFKSIAHTNGSRRVRFFYLHLSVCMSVFSHHIPENPMQLGSPNFR